MARQFRLWEAAQIVDLLPPAADAGGRTSSYVSLAAGHKAFIVCKVNQGNAAQVTFTPLQATDNLGTNSKGLTSAAPIASDENTVASDALVPQTAATSYQTAVTTNKKIVIFEIEPQEVMDINNITLGAFQHLAIETSASNAANITEATLFVMPLRYQQQTPPTTYV